MLDGIMAVNFNTVHTEPTYLQVQIFARRPLYSMTGNMLSL